MKAEWISDIAKNPSLLKLVDDFQRDSGMRIGRAPILKMGLSLVLACYYGDKTPMPIMTFADLYSNSREHIAKRGKTILA